MSVLEKLKNKAKQKITRADIAELLTSIGKPGEKREEKATAVSELLLKNTQNIKLESVLDDYGEY